MNIYYHCLCGFILRLGFLFYGHIQDAYSDVKYTDIDYQVFSDATSFVWKGESPFKRQTYRYSPLLSYMLIPNILVHYDFGKVLFCAFDIFTSLLIYFIQKHYGFGTEICKRCTFLWLYNPMVMVISTRGSSDSIMTFLIMLLLLFYVKKNIFSAGLIYGFAVHMKMYPIIYAGTFYFMLSYSSHIKLVGWEKVKQLFPPNCAKIKFIVSSALGLAIPTMGFIVLYGNEYVNEAVLYHLKRKDVRHNFSPYFYFLYLSDSLNPIVSSIVSLSSFIVQMLLVGVISWIFTSPQLLPSCLFIETYIFVTFNKVCTSQYFLWYLCLFPLCYPQISSYHKEAVYGFSLWFLGQVIWLIPAYYFEFKGYNTLFLVFLASLCFLTINVLLIGLYVKFIMKPKLQPIKPE